MCESEKQRDIRMSTARFVDHIAEGSQAHLRYCFILGAGASFTSGIPTGLQLMPEWIGYLREREKQTPGYIKECAADCGLENDKWEPLFQADYEIKSEDYFTLYDLRFAGQSIQAYHYLQEKMEKAEPSIGYYMLAVLLENTENKLVITTNFDSLVEDVLYLYHAKHPLVVGHESLAPFIETTENIGRPVVAKVHRDLNLRPLNREAELKKLNKGWKKPLQTALSKYIPIVIGYAGGDRTLMALLEQMNLDTIYWCSLKDRESQRIEALLHRMPRGYLVKINGFDEVILALTDRMMQERKFDHPIKRMEEFFERRKKSFETQYEKTSDNVLDRSTAAESRSKKQTAEGESEEQQHAVSPETESAASLQLLKKLAEPESGTEDDVKKAIRLRLDAVIALFENQLEKALGLCREAISLQPENPDLYHLKGEILHKMGRYEEALQDESEAIGLNSENARYYDSRSTTLHEMGRYEEALSDSSEAIRLDPENAKYYDSRSTTLHEMGRYEEALNDSFEAIRLEPENARYLNSRGITLQKMHRYEEALQDDSEAIRLDPENAKYYDSRSTTFHEMGRYEEALSDSSEAIRLDPENAKYYDSRSTTLHEMGRYEEALSDSSEAVRLEPENARYLNSRGITLQKMHRYEEALQDESEAIRLDSENAKYYDSRSTTFHKMGRYEEALSDSSEAIRLEPENARYFNSRGVTLHEMGRYEEALNDSSEAIRLEPENAKYYDSRSTTLHQMGRYEEALNDSSEAIRLEPENARYYESRGITLREMGRYEEALQDYQAAIQLDLNNEVVYGGRSRVYFALGDYESALSDASTAILLNPTNPQLYEQRAPIHEAMGHPELAEADRKEAERLRKKNGAAHEPHPRQD